MSIHWSQTPYDQDLLPDLTQATSIKLQVGSDNNKPVVWGKLAEHKRCKAKAQEEAWLEAERQEQAQLKEEKVHAEAEVQRLEAACKAEEARKVAESWWADALVGSSIRARSNVEVMNPWCLHCTQTNMTCLHNTDGKKKCLASNWCNELKEHCWWLIKGETGTGTGLVIDKGKRKVDVEEDVGKGPSTKKASEETRASPVTGDQMECLIKAVECVADNVVSLTMAQWEASRNFYQFTRSYETYVEEHFEFLVLDVPSDWDTTDEEGRGVEGLNEELEGLRREEEESWSQSESGDQTSASSAGSQV
ncbi:hypothetical protein M404DRAFT_21777 [Pisolithus tinctorius Marx 270]|uniref:Uncharacterized protein n=1 Tax=Pisolithus tinctorius Marx 270 TaxID=870435 RepID=A0A0C3P9B0_PISTI|nr:hypothetical protein M404DRAFT_21777 [Pisolithus tinctorius Marx 270]